MTTATQVPLTQPHFKRAANKATDLTKHHKPDISIVYFTRHSTYFQSRWSRDSVNCRRPRLKNNFIFTHPRLINTSAFTRILTQRSSLTCQHTATLLAISRISTIKRIHTYYDNYMHVRWISGWNCVSLCVCARVCLWWSFAASQTPPTLFAQIADIHTQFRMF